MGKSKRQKYRPLEESAVFKNDRKSDELKNTTKEDVNKNQFEDEINCKAPLKNGRKHGDANNEPDPKHIDIISDNKDQQNKNMLRDEEIKQNSFSNNRNDELKKIKNIDKNQYEDKNKRKESLIDGSKQDNANIKHDFKDHAISCDKKELSTDPKKKKNATLVENEESDATQEVVKKRSKKNKSKRSDPCPDSNLNSNNITENDYNEPNAISTEKQNSRSTHDHNIPHRKQKFHTSSHNNDSKDNDFTSNRAKTRNEKTNVYEVTHRDAEWTNDNIQKKSNKINKSMNKTINISDKYGKGNCTEWNNQWTVSGNHESLFKRAEHNKTKSKNAREDGPHEDTECLFDEIDEDLFKLSNDFSLAHCVAEDLRMGAGIAVTFKRIFKSVGKLMDQKLKVGDVGVVERHNQYVFYLITKKYSNGKPTMQSLEKTLYKLLEKMQQFKLTKLGIPQLGCGLDNLDWSDVSLLIKKIFSGSNIHITVCIPSKIDIKKVYPLKVFLTPKNLWEMDTKTVLIIFIDLDSIYKSDWTNNVLEEVNKKYPFKENFLRDIKNKKLKPGDIVEYNVKSELIICAFTNQTAYYSSIEDAFFKINRAKNAIYLAIQTNPIGSDVSDDNFIHLKRIVLIYRSIAHQYQSELWLCGQIGQNQTFPYDQYCSQMSTFQNYY